MDKSVNQNAVNASDFKRRGQAKEIWRRFRKNRTAMVGLGIISTILFFVIIADLIAPYDMVTRMDVRAKLMRPCAEHLFGTDGFGRDLLARCLHGGRISLSLGILTSTISMIGGSFFGAICGYYGGKVDGIIMRIMDMFAAIPSILMAMAIVAAMGSSIPNLVLALSISRIPGFTRIVRSSVMGITGQEYIEAAVAGGTGDSRILVKHVLANCIGPIIVQFTMNIALMILQTASLSFMGLGINPPTPEWGSIISESRQFLRAAPHMMICPGILLCFSSLAVSLVGDGLRDALDPRLKS